MYHTATVSHMCGRREGSLRRLEEKGTAKVSGFELLLLMAPDESLYSMPSGFVILSSVVVLSFLSLVLSFLSFFSFTSLFVEP